MRRLLPPGQVSGRSCAGDTPNAPAQSALVSLVSSLFFDSTLRLAEGWDHAVSDLLTKRRQDAIGAVKELLAEFCVLDEVGRAPSLCCEEPPLL